MSDQITLGNLRVKCRFPIIILQQCHIRARWGEHTQAEVLCTVKADEAQMAPGDMPREGLEIVNQEDSGREEILFSGIIRKTELTREGGYAVLRLWAVSNTWRMDIERKSRSFQDTSRTYRQVAEEVLGDYQGTLVWNIPDRQLSYPLIQYQETDYRFLKRLISHLGAGMTAVDFGEGIMLHTGVRKGKRHSFTSLPARTEQGTGMLTEDRRIGWEITGTAFMRVGDVLTLAGRELYVAEAGISFDNSALSCTCKAFPFQDFTQEKISADTLKGVALTGRILKIRQELVKLHLEIDREQSVERAYEFPWKPVTGNLFYAMPEPGTRAALYFGEASEDSAAAVYNIRENGEICGEMADTRNRYYTTNQDKRMYLKPAEMGLLNRTENNAQVAMEDQRQVQVKTTHQISVLAEGQVELRGRQVTLQTPKEATLVRKDMLSPTVINLCNAFDAIGKKGNFAASEPVAEKKRRTAPAVQEERYELDGGTIAAVLASIPAVGEGDGVTQQIAGSMPVIIPR